MGWGGGNQCGCYQLYRMPVLHVSQEAYAEDVLLYD